jgi:Gene product 88
MTTLKRSKDRKVTNSVTPTGNARGANSFGLPSGQAYSCPGATSFCERICYAGKIEKMYVNVSNVLMHNWELLKDASMSAMVSLLDDMIAEFVKETDRMNAKGNAASYDFRIHWDGDFFSRDYAMAWSIVIQRYSTVRFWAYTRTLDVVDILVDIPNLSLYLSSDPVNREAVNACSERYGVPIASVADTFREARESLPDGKVYDCPENGKRMPLITPKGSACLSCGICPDKRGNVTFAVKGR